MDKKHVRVRASRYRSLLSATTSLEKGPGGRSKSKFLQFERKLPRYDPEKEAAAALEIMRKQKSLRYYMMFRYASWKDVFLMGFGIICATIWAVAVPAIFYLTGMWVEIIIDTQYCRNLKYKNFTSWNGTELEPEFVGDDVHKDFLQYMALLCGLTFMFCFLATGSFVLAAENQVCRVRLTYFESILRKDMSWLDNYVEREFGRHMTHDATLLRHGIGERLPYLIYTIVVVPLLFCLAFAVNWVIAFVTAALLVPTMIGAGFLMHYFQKREDEAEDEVCGKAEVFAEQALSNVKAVKLFGAEHYESQRFEAVLHNISKLWKYILFSSICLGVMWWIYFFSGGSMLYLSRGVLAKESTDSSNCLIKYDSIPVPFPYQADPFVQRAGAVFVIFVSVTIATLHLNEILIIFAIISETKKVAADVFFIIDWKSRIDNISNVGDAPGLKAVGKIQFENVWFKYPRKMEMNVLRNINLTVNPGQLVAIIGDIDSGKSTILRLIHRLYDPTHGLVYFDGRQMETLNVAWLRSQIGHVPQKPILFNKTIEENIRYANWGATEAEIHAVCKKAGIHDDIMRLPKGYKTIAGHHGNVLTLPQRRRVAFARAYLQQPKVLLLDDPLSDRDSEYEDILFSAINEMRQNSTVVITATEINSIIRQSDRIYVLDEGRVLEQGNHGTLMDRHGLYSMIEDGMDAGVPAERRQIHHSQLQSYNFAKSLRKMKQDHDSKQLKVEASFESIASQPIQLDGTIVGDVDTYYEYQWKKSETAWIAGGFNTCLFARRNTKTYSLKNDEKGVMKAKNVGGLAILRRELEARKKSVDSAVERRRRPTMVSLNSLPVDNRRRSRKSVVGLRHADSPADDDNVSIYSDHYGDFWDEYQTVLDSLEDKTGATQVPWLKSWKNLLRVAFHKGWIVFLALFTCVALGICSTLYHLIYSDFYEELGTADGLDPNGPVSNSVTAFFIGGAAAGVIGFMQGILFGIGGYKMTARLKGNIFQKMLQQDLEWFDLPENDISILCHRLSIDTAAVENVLLVTFGVITQCFSGLISSGIAAIYLVHTTSPQIDLFVLLTISLSFIFITLLFVDGKFQLHWNSIMDSTLSGVTEIEVDVVRNIRTVITLGLEEHFLAHIKEQLKNGERKILWLNILRTLLFALTRVFPHLIYLAIAYRSLTMGHLGNDAWLLIFFGEVFIRKKIRTGVSLAMLPSTKSARAAALRFWKILNPDSVLQYPSSPAKVEFSKPPAIIIKDLNYSSGFIRLSYINIHVEPSGCLGIVGIGPESGSFMLLNILERFYKQDNGSILFDETDIWTLDMNTFQNTVGFVEESPCVYDLTIKENIVYGKGSEKFTIEEILKTAMDANIHDLIIRLPEGYDTKVGMLPKDDRILGLLQRILLARAIIRDPKVLFINGNISSISEKEDVLFQEALEKCRKNRTWIMATERVSAVQNADFIIVLQDGEILEEGTHADLIASKKLYYQMWMTEKKQEEEEADVHLKHKTSGHKPRSSVAYERYLQKRMYSQIPRTARLPSIASSMAILQEYGTPRKSIVKFQ